MSERRTINRIVSAVGVCALLASTAFAPALACTGIRLTAGDGTVVHARTRSLTLEPTGQGSGMLGLPGDFTPPSRFVRAVAFSQSVFPSKTGYDAVIEAFHILNQFDIPKGSARDGTKDANGNVQADYTLWTAASDPKARRYYFRTYDNSQIRVIDLMSMDLDAKDAVTIPIDGDEVVKSVNP